MMEFKTWFEYDGYVMDYCEEPHGGSFFAFFELYNNDGVVIPDEVYIANLRSKIRELYEIETSRLHLNRDEYTIRDYINDCIIVYGNIDINSINNI